MPFLVPDYSPPFVFQNGHVNTVLPFAFRKNLILPFQRETLATPDHDFIEVDLLKSGHSKCAILVHGLEGSSQSAYILSLAQLLKERGWDIAALNLRGCSGKTNKLYRAYHSGATDDLKQTIDYIRKSYSQLAIIGFSLGGNIVLKYAGDEGTNVPKEIKAVIGISVPCDLSSSCDKLEQWQNSLYSYRFVVSLKAKLKEKMKLFPEYQNEVLFDSIRTIRQLDDSYTAPSNGFRDSEDYYSNCSSLYVLKNITVSTLIVNAQDDPFLTENCFPWTQAEVNPNLQLFAPKYGGHVGFWPDRKTKLPKHEEWILTFLANTNCT